MNIWSTQLDYWETIQPCRSQEDKPRWEIPFSESAWDVFLWWRIYFDWWFFQEVPPIWVPTGVKHNLHNRAEGWASPLRCSFIVSQMMSLLPKCTACQNHWATPFLRLPHDFVVVVFDQSDISAQNRPPLLFATKKEKWVWPSLTERRGCTQTASHSWKTPVWMHFLSQEQQILCRNNACGFCSQ